ncbi:alpha/beta fold hydrolase [Chloroflexota bacterium]
MRLLFIPGSGSGKEAWVYQTEYFTDSEAIALPGHPDGEPCHSVDEYVEWLRAYIHQQQYQDVVLVGHSLGGAIAQLYGLKYGDEVKALVLVGTGARLRVSPDILASMEGMIGDEIAWRKWVEDVYSSATPKFRQAAMEAKIRIGPAVRLSDLLCCDKFDIMDRVHTIKLPTLVLCGSEDEMTPVKYTKYLADKIEGVHQVIIDGASHAVASEKPEEVNQAIESFLAGLN